MRPGLIALVTGVAVVALTAPSPVLSAPEVGRELPTPLILERAVARGGLDRATADLYLALSLTPDYRKVPAAFRSGVPWEGTPWLLGLRERLATMQHGPKRVLIRQALSPTDNCDGVTGPHTHDTTHFHIHHQTITGGLDEVDYGDSLETAWSKEVDTFGWGAPPLSGPKYLVAVAPLGALFGFVNPTGFAPGGNNPNTPWNDGDAETSCMALNSDFSQFPPSSSQQALDSTTAHELNHSIQFGYGALDFGPAEPDAAFYEGGATWMEDEVFDGADDNYQYLWPDFTDDMGQYQDNSPLADPYSYWVVLRAMTEPHGVGVGGGGEQIMQDFWELTSRNAASNLDALDDALRNRGSTLPDAYHAAAIALKFNRSCGGGYVPPHCLEEGPAYVNAAGATPLHRQISSVGGSVEGSVLDNYALNWVGIPTGAPVQVRLRNQSANGGKLKASVACDTGSGLRIKAFPQQAGPGETVVLKNFDAVGCQNAAAVITNVEQTAANPNTSAARPYQVTVAPPAEPSKTTLRVKVRPGEIVAKGKLKPPHPGKKIRVTLSERDGNRWDKVDRERAPLRRGRKYKAVFDRPDASRCRVEARFGGDLDHNPSKRVKTVSC
ncbi:MAG: hypothetical protein ACRDHB_00905 [Actinomycetota bacterium]